MADDVKRKDARSKKLYWLKLDRNFFKRHDVRIIESMPNGKDYILFYMKLLLESTSHEGHLRFNETIPYNESMLATITDTNIDIVRSAVKLFEELHLMELLDDKTIYMTELHKMVGFETLDAERKRIERSNQRLLLENKKDSVGQRPEKSLNISISNNINLTIKEIIDYLNSILRTRYTYKNTNYNSKIKARLDDGFTVDDFKQVIDTKYAEWNNTDMKKYLNPDTLFRQGNFEKYLNQKNEITKDDIKKSKNDKSVYL